MLNARTAFFYGITGITPAMAMRMTGIGSQHLFVSLDADKNYFDGSKTYKVTLPKEIPAEKFWSLTVYDNETRRCSIRRNATPAPAARAIPRPPQSRTPTTPPRRSTSARTSPRASSEATGSKPRPARVGVRDSTAL